MSKKLTIKKAISVYYYREHQVLNNITTFDAIQRKMSCSLVYRCYDSNNKLIFSLMTSGSFINSAYYKYYNTLVYSQ